jgi:hypothetical protein
LINPSQWAPAIAWGVGIASNRLEKQVEERLAAAARSQETQSSAPTKLNLFAAEAAPAFKSDRKAA